MKKMNIQGFTTFLSNSTLSPSVEFVFYIRHCIIFFYESQELAKQILTSLRYLIKPIHDKKNNLLPVCIFNEKTPFKGTIVECNHFILTANLFTASLLVFAYLLVVLIDACPSTSCTTSIETPLFNNFVATVCLRRCE